MKEIKKTIIPHKFRSKYLLGSGNYVSNTRSSSSATTATNTTSIEIIGLYDDYEFKDTNVLSSLKTKSEIDTLGAKTQTDITTAKDEAISAAATSAASKYLKKTEADTASEKITFEKGILIGTKDVTAVKRSSDSDTDVPLDDKSIATPAWVEQNAISKTKEDSAAERITFRKGLIAYSTSTEGAGNGITEGEESEIIEVDASDLSDTIGGLENVSDAADNASAGSILSFDGTQWAVIPSQADIATDIANMLVPVWHTVLNKMIFVPCSILSTISYEEQ